ncbi:MAG: Hsp70 family protein, partial [Verrucomicrobiota bacterium]
VLGTFRLDGIPPAPRGMPQIEVTFDIDANGILHVSAKDLGTGKDQKITIQGSSGLSKEEVEKMTKEAELHAAEDKKRKEAVETKNQLDSAVYQLEKTIKDSGDKLPAAIKSKGEAAIVDAKKELESNDLERMKAAMEKLTAVGGEIYQEAQKAGQAAGAADAGQPASDGPSAKPEGAPKKTEKKADVVDADFEVVDEDKKK